MKNMIAVLESLLRDWNIRPWDEHLLGDSQSISF